MPKVTTLKEIGEWARKKRGILNEQEKHGVRHRIAHDPWAGGISVYEVYTGRGWETLVNGGQARLWDNGVHFVEVIERAFEFQRRLNSDPTDTKEGVE